MTKLQVCIAAILLSSCGTAADAPHIVQVAIYPNTCPMPVALSRGEQQKLSKFGAELAELLHVLGGVSFEATIQDALKKEYPAADMVNQIYALTYAACVSCRVNPGNVIHCANGFKKILDRYTVTHRSPDFEDRPLHYRYRDIIFSDLITVREH